MVQQQMQAQHAEALRRQNEENERAITNAQELQTAVAKVQEMEKANAKAQDAIQQYRHEKQQLMDRITTLQEEPGLLLHLPSPSLNKTRQPGCKYTSSIRGQTR